MRACDKEKANEKKKFCPKREIMVNKRALYPSGQPVEKSTQLVRKLQPDKKPQKVKT